MLSYIPLYLSHLELYHYALIDFYKLFFHNSYNYNFLLIHFFEKKLYFLKEAFKNTILRVIQVILSNTEIL